jgi:hypothetical protein
MNLHLNQADIIDMCGTVSCKKGEAFYRADKVIIDQNSADSCKATVVGKEDFHIKIENQPNGKLRATCSCPQLASIKHDCQHIAAVLWAIHMGTVPNQPLTDGLFSLFDGNTRRSSRHQLHFEKREVLDVAFHCKPVRVNQEQSLLGIAMDVGSVHVKEIRGFLEQIAALSASFIYDPQRHCFEEETDVVIQQLIQVVHDEKVYAETNEDHLAFNRSRDTLVIPPSSWRQLVPLLSSAPDVTVKYGDHQYDGFHVSKEIPPLQFDFSEAENGDYELKVDGLERIWVLRPYQSVITGGKFVRLEWEESERISELKQLLENSETKQIPIPCKQINYFLEKVVPGLKRIGTVQVSASMYQDFLKKPLKAKLYLDRVKNRLLAGLEFHYDGIVINPLEGEVRTGPLLIRDEEKEAAILQYMDAGEFAKTDGG